MITKQNTSKPMNTSSNDSNIFPNDNDTATNTLIHTLGLSVMMTTSAITLHHLWRKRQNPNAQVSDYLQGATEQMKRIEQATQQAWKSWWYEYKGHTGSQENQHKNSRQGTTTPHSKVNTTDNTMDSSKMYSSTTHSSKTYSNTVHRETVNDKPKSSSLTPPAEWVSGVANKSASKNSDGEFDEFSVVGIDSQRRVLWQTDVPERVHDIVVQPLNHSAISLSQANTLESTSIRQNLTRDVAVMGRRPSEYFWILDSATGEILDSIRASYQRHFYGHACYSLDGRWLYVTENDTKTFEGMIGVYDAENSYRKINEFLTHGIGCHEVILHPDGDKLVVANGGIKTERASREELNLESMKPSLAYFSLKQGEEGKLLQQIEPKHNQMSVRHISAIIDGKFKDTIAIGIQFQGEKHLNMPLVLTHKFGDKAFTEYQPTTDWRQFHHYIASVMVNTDSNLICATSPIGGCVSVFDMNTQKMVDTVKIADCAGIAVANLALVQSLEKEADRQGNHKQADKTTAQQKDYQENHQKNQQQSKVTDFIVSDGQGGLTLLTLEGNQLITDTMKLPMAFDNHMQRLA